MRLLLTALLLPIGLCADPITITVANQKTQTSVSATAGTNSCMMSNPFSSECLVPGSIPGSGASAFASVNGLSVAAQAGAGEVGSYAFAAASFTETIQINGGTGTGYLNIGLQTILTNSYDASFEVSLGGASVYNPQYSTLFSVIPFEFGKPLSFNVEASAGTSSSENFSYGNVQGSIIETRIYTHMPTGCSLFINQPCSDPTFTPANFLTGVATPEPSTALLGGLALFAFAFVGRLWSRGPDA